MTGGVIFQTDSRKKPLLVLQAEGEEVRSSVGEMTKIERVAGGGVLSRVRESLRGWLFGDNTGVEVITVSGLRGKG